jgi:tryptophan-rich sensory protein
MATLDDRQKGRLALGFVGFIALCFAAAAFGGFFTAPATQPGAWYDWIRKPAWTPPSWLFGPVWTLLYGAMAVAAWLVWRAGGWAAQRRPLTLFVVQLVLNALWSLFFFGMQSPGLALIDIALLWLAILATLLAFRKVSALAAGLLVPYLLWVSFAAALNFAVWRLNG